MFGARAFSSEDHCLLPLPFQSWSGLCCAVNAVPASCQRFSRSCSWSNIVLFILLATPLCHAWSTHCMLGKAQSRAIRNELNVDLRPSEGSQTCLSQIDKGMLAFFFTIKYCKKCSGWIKKPHSFWWKLVDAPPNELFYPLVVYRWPVQWKFCANCKTKG